jgi:hypothetical protein
MTSGSGSNLKMLDYFAAGLPVLSTPFGARGIDVKAGTHYIESEIENFISSISMYFVQSDSGRISKMCAAAKEIAHLRYSWQAIAKRALKDKLGQI